MAAPMQVKVGHVGKQRTSLGGELGSVSRISMATRREQIEYIKYCQKLTFFMTVGSEREK